MVRWFSSPEPDHLKPVLVIVGGGYAGITLAEKLDITYFVILIDRKDSFVHKIAHPRAIVQPEFASRLNIPYTNLLRYGVFIQATVTSITDKHIIVADISIPYDEVVLATGSAYAWPFRMSSALRSNLNQSFVEVGNKIKTASSVLIVGSGPVGCEIACEIATDYPHIQVTLVGSSTQLVRAGFAPKFYTNVEQKLGQLRVNVVKGERVQIPDDLEKAMSSGGVYYSLEPATYSTTKGTSFTADIAFFSTGTVLNTSVFLASPVLAQHVAEGGLAVNSNFQVGSQPNIFAIGDAVKLEEKFGFRAVKQAEWLSKYLQAKRSGQTAKVPPYKPVDAMIFLSMGRNNGVGTSGGPNGLMFPSFIVTLVKSKDMLSGRYWKQLHAKDGKETSRDTVHIAQKLQRRLQLKQEEAEKLAAGIVVEVQSDHL